MSNWNVQLFELDFDERERDAVNQTLQSGWITSGPKTAEFETAFSDFNGGKYFGCAVSSCTAALHLSLIASNVGAGDEVVVSALTFVAAANVVRYVGADVVLADCESEDDWNVSLKRLQAVVTEKTKAVIIVHFAGNPCRDIEKIADFCREQKISLIEDVAHAPGAKLNNNMCGTFGDFGCFSFFTNKNLSMGEGGFILCRSQENYKRVSRLRSHGMTVGTLDRYKGKALTYDVEEPGLNYRIDELRASIGLVQLSKLIKGNLCREKLVNQYTLALADCKAISTFKFISNDQSKPAYHIFPILLEASTNRLDFMQYLKIHGIQTSIHYPALSKFSGLKHWIRGQSQTAIDLSSREVTLPLHTNLTVEHVCYVCETIRNYFND